MRRIAADVRRGLSIGPSRNVSCKRAEPIEMPFGMWARVGPSNHVLKGVQNPSPQVKGQYQGWKDMGMPAVGLQGLDLTT